MKMVVILETREKDDPQHGLALEGERGILEGRCGFGLGLLHMR